MDTCATDNYAWNLGAYVDLLQHKKHKHVSQSAVLKYQRLFAWYTAWGILEKDRKGRVAYD